MSIFRSILIKCYGYLLHLYPRSYQEEFAEEMLLDFSDMATDAGKKGISAFMFFLLHELIDFPVNLLKTYLSEAAMTPNFRPGAARTILRTAFAFGLALALNTFAGVVAFLDQIPLPAIWRLGHFFGWRGTYQDIQAILMNVSGLILGPVLAAIILLAIFPELRPIKRYLPAIALAFALPTMLSIVRSTVFKNPDLAFEDTIFALAGYILFGLGFGVIASLLSGERRKRLWLLLAGPVGYFLTIWVSNLLIFRSHHEHQVTFWGSVASVAIRNALIGMAMGLLLGLILEFKRRCNSPSRFPSV